MNGSVCGLLVHGEAVQCSGVLFAQYPHSKARWKAAEEEEGRERERAAA